MLYDNGPKMPSYTPSYGATPTPAPPRLPPVLFGGGGGGGGRSYADYYNGLTGQRASSRPSIGDLRQSPYLMMQARRGGFAGYSPLEQRFLNTRPAGGGQASEIPYSGQMPWRPPIYQKPQQSYQFISRFPGGDGRDFTPGQQGQQQPMPQRPPAVPYGVGPQNSWSWGQPQTRGFQQMIPYMS